jgi:hypothetical protein
VTSFGLRSLAAMVVLLGIAVFDFGPRASASFWSTLSAPESSGAVGQESDFTDQSSPVGPPIDQGPSLNRNTLANCGLGESGGAGSPPTATTGGSVVGQPLAFIGSLTLVFRESVQRLRIAEIRSDSLGLVTSIFEPPRVVV